LIAKSLLREFECIQKSTKKGTGDHAQDKEEVRINSQLEELAEDFKAEETMVQVETDLKDGKDDDMDRMVEAVNVMRGGVIGMHSYSI